MKFSIIIPAHNSEQYIRKALDSIESQVYTDYECIVVCDACTDKTESVVRSYGFRTQVVNYNNDGLTRNMGMDLARGDWVLFMDDDDWWLHEYVLTQLADKIDQNPDIDIIAFSFIFRGWKYADPKGNEGNRWIAVWNKCWKRSIIRDVRFPNIYSTSDVDFHFGVMKKNPKILDWDMPMYYYNYMRKGSITEKQRGNRL